MSFFFKILSFSASSSFILTASTFYSILTFTFIDAATFQIQNLCSYTVWAAANPGGGKELHQGQTWIIDNTGSGSIWARTNCKFDAKGTGKCETGDCDGSLNCVSNGALPFTLAEYTLNASNNLDSFDVSLVTGFNVPLEFKGTSTGCTKETKCIGNINELCPTELRHPGGCNNPCTVFRNDQFCCPSLKNCGPTAYSKFFKDLCPDADTSPVDDATSLFTCPTGTDYKVVFCPGPVAIPGATFDVRNNCPYTVWVAAVPGGGQRLDRGETWIINVKSGTRGGRIWARTNCQFDAAGKGKCETGDCDGVLQCTSYGVPPNTLAEYALGQFNDVDYIDMSNIDGFNVPMEFSSKSPGCNGVINCSASIVSECPNALKAPGGCNGPCSVFKTEEYCCNSGNCGPTNYSRFFKERCPDVYSYPKDDPTSLFTCPSGTDYKVVFCP